MNLAKECLSFFFSILVSFFGEYGHEQTSPTFLNFAVVGSDADNSKAWKNLFFFFTKV